MLALLSALLVVGTARAVSFSPKTDFATGVSPQSVAIGDFNGDGKSDLAVANRDDSTVSILLGTGTGSFGPKTDFATGTIPFVGGHRRLQRGRKAGPCYRQ
ncbi:MAG: VCBS repeat-containing protein [Chloroflexota bacterium]|nr:VCBS repeat-containing protein [Chloroflexota bacterium]